MDANNLAEVPRTLWAAADQLRTNSTLAPSEYRVPVLGLVFLAYAEHRFEEVREFSTPRSIVRLIEALHGRVSDPRPRVGRHVRALRQVRGAPPGLGQ